MKRTITVEEYEELCATFFQLTEILLIVGVVELKISKKEREIFWDTENKGKIDPLELERFGHLIDGHWMNIAMKVEKQNEKTQVHSLS